VINGGDFRLRVIEHFLSASLAIRSYSFSVISDEDGDEARGEAGGNASVGGLDGG